MKFFVTPLILFFSFLIPTQANYFRNYRVDDGLSHNCVWTVMQDSEGFMWFGTNDGLNRFDGNKFRIYRKQQGDSLSIGHNFIHCIKEVSHRRLLVGTKQGLYMYDRIYDHFKRINLGRRNDKDASINCIMEDPNGNIWLATHGFGLYRLNSDLTIRKHYSEGANPNSLPTNFIWTVITDHFGNLWLGTAGKGLVLFEPKKEYFTTVSEQKGLGINDMTVYSLYCDIDNCLWIGTGTSGLIKYNYTNGKVSHFLDNASSVKSIIEYSDHELIMGSERGLIKFNRINETFTMINEDSPFDNITDNSIFSITRDKEGSFWIGTYFGGVNYYSPAINKFLYIKDITGKSAQDYIISSMVEEDDGNILIGTHNDNIYRYNTKKKQFGKAYNIGSQNVQCLMLDKDKLYVGLYGRGIYVLSAIGNRTLGKLDINVIGGKSIFKTSKGGIYIAPEGGGCMYMERPGELRNIDKFTGIQVKDIAEDFNGSIWFGTHSHGLMRMRSDGKWDTYTSDSHNSKSLISNYVNCVFQDAKYRIWVGTEGSGLTLFNTSKNCFEKVFNDKSGLPSNLVYSIIDDASGNLWVSTGGGIVRISADLSSIRDLGYVGRKVQDYLNCSMRSSDNRLYFGGTSGFISINPKEFSENTTKPKVFITSFKIFDKEILYGEKSSPLSASIEQTKEITLNHNQSTFSFDFSVLSYLSTERNKYAYKLEGFDNDWINVSDNKASFMNIPPGKYIFRVKGANNDGVWSEVDTNIMIRIKPPFWLSNIMIILYILLFSGSTVYIVRRYRKYVDAKNQEKIDRYHAIKEKEMYESQINFFTNIAHEIRTPLSLISAPLENIILSGDGSDQTKKNLGLIERNANRLLELINQLLDFRKIEENMFIFNFRNQSVVNIVQKVYDQYSDAAKLNSISMIFNVEEDVECSVDSEAIYKIMSNLLTNAMKFAKSCIEVRIRKVEDDLLITVEDDGVGIEQVHIDKIFEPFYQIQGKALGVGTGLGLSLSQSLAKKHGGLISVKSENGKGCLFTLRLPITNSGETMLEEEEIAVSNDIDPNLQLEMTYAETGLKVLIVEDNKELRTFIRESLSDSYVVFEAENGIKALEIVEKDSVDIIISDILMPEMDGLELCNKLKSDPAYSHLPLILLSAKTDTSSKIDGLNKGADVYMDKPFSIEQLKAQINSVIDNRNKIRDNFIKSPLLYFKLNTDNNESAEFIKKLNDAILEKMSDENFTIDSLSGEFAISRSNFHKKVKNISGMTPNDYIKLIRLNKSAQLLLSGKYRINEVCYLVGFNTPSYFAKCFFEQYGKLPKDFMQTDGE
ncbi:MAG: two-component regulator propeller domain-containing protein [Bacteroidales bacterium]|nr:two-component regulator propeller domain-containing protein [Bacteroidales bacterium]